jgi:iron complex transport system ATP-binding protein
VRVLGHVQTLARRGIAVILSTHDPDQAFLCADRAALLHGGRLVRLGAPEEVITPASLQETYGVEVEVRELQRTGAGPVRVCVPSLARHRAPGGIVEP